MTPLLLLLENAVRDLAGLWVQSPRSRQILYASGLLLVASGIFHVGVIAYRRGSWSGPLSWRKPILFGLSGGITTLSIAWVVGLVAASLPESSSLLAWEPAYDLSFAVLMTFEIGLITLQTWRGVASHFNIATPVDRTIATLMALSIFLITIEIFLLTLAAFWPLAAAADLALAARAGLILLFIGCLLGFWSASYGTKRVMQRQAPEIYGARGVMKFPHGLPLHAIQYLPVQSWLMAQLRLGETTRFDLVAASALGISLLTVYALLQTLGGRARFEFSPVSALLFAVALLLFGLPFLVCGLAMLGCW